MPDHNLCYGCFERPRTQVGLCDECFKNPWLDFENGMNTAHYMSTGQRKFYKTLYANRERTRHGTVCKDCREPIHWTKKYKPILRHKAGCQYNHATERVNPR
jgi:hypothetical protein